MKKMILVCACCFIGCLYHGTMPYWTAVSKGSVTEVIPLHVPNQGVRARFHYLDLNGQLAEGFTAATNDARHLRPGDQIEVVIWPFWPYFAQVKDVAKLSASRCRYGAALFAVLLVIAVLALRQARKEERAGGTPVEFPDIVLP